MHDVEPLQIIGRYSEDDERQAPAECEAILPYLPTGADLPHVQSERNQQGRDQPPPQMPAVRLFTCEQRTQRPGAVYERGRSQ